MPLLSVDSDPKTSKGAALGYLTGILYLAPSTAANGKTDLCPNASPGCRAACLYTAGRAGFLASINEARVRKTLTFLADRDAFMAQLIKDIEALIRKAGRENLTPTVRLNGTSDLPWHKIPAGDAPNIMALFPTVQFYDYTKDPRRPLEALPANYDVTFSRSETNHADVLKVLKAGGRAAVVFKGALPATWNGAPVVDGDKTDLRFLDPAGAVVGLKAKGAAIKDTSGFVVVA